MEKGIKPLFVLLVFALVLAACGDSTQDTQADDTSVPADLSGEQAKVLLLPGETAEIADLLVTVHAVAKSEGTEYFMPEEGNIFVIIDVTIENRGEAEEEIAPFLQTRLTDGEGNRFEPSLNALMGAETPLEGKVAPGGTLHGQVGYEVPADAAGLVFVFKDPFKMGEAAWSLEKAAEETAGKNAEQIQDSPTGEEFRR